jgi:hypothetical protein
LIYFPLAEGEEAYEFSNPHEDYVSSSVVIIESLLPEKVKIKKSKMKNQTKRTLIL